MLIAHTESDTEEEGIKRGEVLGGGGGEPERICDSDEERTWGEPLAV